MDVRSVTTKFGADTSGFSAGKERLKSDLNEINKNFYANKTAMSEVNKELKALQKEMKAYNSTVGPKTAEQTSEYAKMETKLSSLTLKQAQLKTTEQTLKAQISSTTGELTKQNKSLDDVHTSAGKASNSLGGLGTVLKGVIAVGGGKALTDYFIGSNADMEQYLTSFEVLLGSANKAKSFMAELQTFADDTTFELPDVTKYATNLVSYGVDAKDVIGKLTQLGDLSLGNVTKLDSISSAYGKMKNSGKVTLEYLNQMTENGVPILQALAETMGVTTESILGMITDGAVKFSDMESAITSLTTGTGKFAGMLEKQSKTMAGELSTLHDKFISFGRTAGADAFEQVKSELDNLMTAIDTASKNGTLEEVAKELGDAINTLVTGLIKAAEIAWEYRDAIGAVVVGTLAFKAALTVTELVMGVVAGIKALTSALGLAKVAQEGAAVAQVTLNGAMIANPIALVVSAVAALVGGLIYLTSTADSAANTIKDYNKAMEQTKQNSEDNISNSNAEIAVIQTKADRYEELRTKVNLTAAETAELTQVATDLQTVLPNGTVLLNAQTGAYDALGTSIDNVIAKMKAQVLLDNSTAEFKTAVTQGDKIDKDVKTAEKNLKKKLYNAADYTGIDKSEVDNGTWTAESSVTVNHARSELKKLQDQQALNQKEQAKYKTAYEDYATSVTQANNKLTDEQTASIQTIDTALKGHIITQEQYNAKYAEIMGTQVKITTSATKEIDATVKASIDTLKAQHDIGEVSDETYYADLSTLLVSHESEKLGAYKSYYKEIYDYQQSSNKTALSEQKTAAKEAESLLKDSQKKQVEDLQIALDDSEITQEQYNETLEALAKTWGENGITYLHQVYKSRKELTKKADEEELKTNKENLDKLIDQKKDAYETAYNERKTSINNMYSAQEDAADKEYNALEKATNAKIKLMEEEDTAQKELLQGKIDAIDKEIEARKRLTEDTDSQKEIDVVQGKLSYSQLDDFSRMELEKELANLQSAKSETDWQRSKSDEKSGLQEELGNVGTDTTSLKEQLEQAKELADYKKQALKDEQEKVIELLETEKTKMEESFTTLSENSEKIVTENMDNINAKTAAMGVNFATTVKTEIGAAFDYSITKANDAIAQLRAATGYASQLAADIQAAASASAGSTTTTSNSNNSVQFYSSNSNLSAEQVARAAVGLMYD